MNEDELRKLLSDLSPIDEVKPEDEKLKFILDLNDEIFIQTNDTLNKANKSSSLKFALKDIADSINDLCKTDISAVNKSTLLKIDILLKTASFLAKQKN